MPSAELAREGKTKRIVRTSTPGVVRVLNKDEITKNDDPSQTRVMDNKAVHATATTSFVFSLLKEAGIPVAFHQRDADTVFLAPECEMIGLEVIIRRYGVGSYLKRFPNLEKEKGELPHRFHRLVFELFLKTTGGKIVTKGSEVCGETPIDTTTDTGRPVDDPFIANPYDHVWNLMHPKIPGWVPASDLNLCMPPGYILPDNVTVADIEELARKTFLVLECAWGVLGYRLIDFKIEFGIGPNGELLVADVIDNDSWRLRTSDWQEVSKQLFRDNAEMGVIADKYALVANLVSRFRQPKQAIVLWRGSENDPKFPEVPEVPGLEKVEITVSGHKSPAHALAKLEEVLTRFPEGGVILAHIGMSNGLGPILAARTTWPVIAVPMTAKDRPHDVWSSLECPSNVPLMTVLSPKNAVLAALNVLARNNPALYMYRQYLIESLDS